MAIRIGINGFGRIGRLVYRAAIQRGGFEIVGVNDLVPADNLAYLLQYDTNHGRFQHEVKASGESFSVAGMTTRTLSEREPAKLPWKDLGCTYVLESTGRFTEFEAAKAHITAGAKRVTVTLDIVPDDENPTANLSAQDEDGELLASVRVAPSFKLNRASAVAWAEAGFAKPASR